MDLKKYKIKLTKNTVHPGENLPGYSLSYKLKERDPNPACYDILAAIVGGSDLIIELNTDLFGNSSPREEDCAEKFIRDVSTRCLAFSQKKFPSEQRLTLFGFLMAVKNKKEALRVAAYIPNDVWSDRSFQSVLPSCGALYYILKEPSDAEALVSEILSMPEGEKTEKLRFTVFNMASFGIMGINAYSISEKELRSLLGA